MILSIRRNIKESMLKVKTQRSIIYFILITLCASAFLSLFFRISHPIIWIIGAICVLSIFIVVFTGDVCSEQKVQKQRETYISTLSHDLTIPTLAQIRALDLLLDENVGKINKEQREIINLTLDSCKFMYDMLSTILATYKYENKEISLNFEKTLIFKLVDDCIIKFTKELEAKNIHIRVRAKDDSAIISADRKQIKKAFDNLISHSISTAYENTDVICEFRKTSDGKNINVIIAFESPYVTAETLKNMFNMYNTPADKMDKVGSGLSLYLARQIIEAHGGNINVESFGKDYHIYNVELPCYINECKIPAAVM